MLTTPCRVWFMPATRARCLLGTIREVEEVMAGLWNAPPSERTSRMTYICQTCTIPVAKRKISTPVANAIEASADDHDNPAVPTVNQCPHEWPEDDLWQEGNERSSRQDGS